MMDQIKQLISDYPIIFLDLETNGLAVNTDVLEVGALKFGPGELLSPIEPVGIPFHSYVYFDGQPDPGAFSVNRLDPAVLREQGVPMPEVLHDLNIFLEGGLVGGQNVQSFDLPILHYHAARNGLDFDYNAVLDTLLIARKTVSLPRYNLAALSSHFGVTHLPTHRALDDVKATMQVFRKLIGL